MSAITLGQADAIITAAIARGGAVGITGDPGDNDEACAFAGIAAAGPEARR